MASMALGFILLACACACTASASWFPSESQEYRLKVYRYASSLYTDPDRKNIGEIGISVIEYGRTFTNCLGDNERTENRHPLKNSLEQYAAQNDMTEVINNFHKNFIEPEGEDKDLLLNMISPCIQENIVVLQTENAVGSTELQLEIPVQPNLELSSSECEKLALYIDRTKFHVQNSRYELGFYTLSIFAFENFHDTDKEIENAHKHLLRYRRHLRDHMRDYGKRKLEQMFSDFMNFRDKKQEMIEKDILQSTEPDKKAELQKQLTFHQQTSRMMLLGWMKVNRLAVTDGKLSIVDHNLKTERPYDVTSNLEEATGELNNNDPIVGE